jgi:hypothetical protein
MKHFVGGGAEKLEHAFSNVRPTVVGRIEAHQNRGRSNSFSSLLDFTSGKINVLHRVFPGVRESRRQEIYGLAFSHIERILAEAPHAQSQTYEPYTAIEAFTHILTSERDRLLVGTTTPKDSEKPIDVFVRGILRRAVVTIIHESESGKYRVIASDHFGERTPPTARQIKRRLSFLESYRHP